MTHYLIEFRFSGSAKKYLKNLIYQVANKFKVRGAIKNRAIPHITLIGPLFTSNEQRLVNEFRKVVSKYDLMNFKMNGFGHFGVGFWSWLTGKKKVVFVEIKASEQLNNMRLELVKKLKDFCKLNEYDYSADRHLHATIAFKDIDRKFSDIWNYLQTLEQPKTKQGILRITLIKNQKILYEYDFLHKKLFNRFQAKNKELYKQTISLLKKKSH